jgi:hypothetical protein
MKSSILALTAVALLAPQAMAAASGTTRGVSNAALIAAAQGAPVRLIDNLEAFCDGDTAIGKWLAALTVREARDIAWTAGPCELVNRLNPLDAGGRYCVQATITLKHPSSRDDRPEVEIYLEDPKHGRPGAVYAFRSSFVTVDGPDYERAREDFESQWRERFPHTAPRPCQDDG